MGLYIKGLEMPECCTTCMFCDYDVECCKLSWQRVAVDGRREDCPLQESKIVTLTKEDAAALETHLQDYILQDVRENPDYDNLDYFIRLCDIYKRCKAATEEDE